MTAGKDHDGPAVVRRATSLEGLDWLAAFAEREDLTFVSRLLQEWREGLNRFNRAREGLFAAEVGSVSVGVCGLNIDPYAQDPLIGRVRHFYVAPAFRRRGVGTALIETIVREARRSSFEGLRLRTDDPRAARFYTAHGFARVEAPTWTHEMDLLARSS